LTGFPDGHFGLIFAAVTAAETDPLKAILLIDLNKPANSWSPGGHTIQRLAQNKLDI
jgi:hypothetical protein